MRRAACVLVSFTTSFTRDRGHRAADGHSAGRHLEIEPPETRPAHLTSACTCRHQHAQKRTEVGIVLLGREHQDEGVDRGQLDLMAARLRRRGGDRGVRWDPSPAHGADRAHRGSARGHAGSTRGSPRSRARLRSELDAQSRHFNRRNANVERTFRRIHWVERSQEGLVGSAPVEGAPVLVGLRSDALWRSVTSFSTRYFSMAMTALNHARSLAPVAGRGPRIFVM